MKPIIKVLDVTLNKLKNVKYGTFHIDTHFDTLDEANVIGFYGQNGSGKTAVVQAFQLLAMLLKGGQNEKLPDIHHLHIYYGEPSLQLNFQFLVKNDYGEFFLKYGVSLVKGERRLNVMAENLSYRENKRGKRFKNIISKNEDDITIRTTAHPSLNENDRVKVLVANHLSKENNSSFIFRKEVRNILPNYLDEAEMTLIQNIIYDFKRDLHIIDNTQYGNLISNITMPFHIHLENKRGVIPSKLEDTTLLPKALFDAMKELIEQTNIVLKMLIPGLQIKIHVIHTQKMNDGSDGVLVEFLSRKGDIELPLKCESEGTLKIISILSTLIAVYNNPNACVVIDELDAGVFEYLLGELLEIINENGSGQLIFTSHNLRILEVLPIHELWFTTTNEENRYMQLKGVKKLNNPRDVYLRAVQLGGQDEDIYKETNSYDIKRAFRKAGIVNE
ncbi:ATP-binding protein [Viridibacillus sp. YIM B01967]|uniref:ATP-binding protein n=1 Tax=Viridibacillus soli TaxID=2798301 RepID=A0ABS1H991_9BACL|nr:AAA family ATPase [Viridibacillus soli]MBK3495876.1 ATP-binding protein [Viridibacillus soli]